MVAGFCDEHDFSATRVRKGFLEKQESQGLSWSCFCEISGKTKAKKEKRQKMVIELPPVLYAFKRQKPVKQNHNTLFINHLDGFS